MSDAVPADDRGLLLGDGLFETVLFKAGRAILWAEHIDRLARGCAALGLPAPDADALGRTAAAALASAGLGEARAAVRLSWTAGSGGRGLDRPSHVKPRLIVSAAPSERPTSPAVLALSDIRRNETSPTSRHKTLAYLDNVMARRQARAQGADEALMLNSQGEIAGCAAANFFWIEDNCLRAQVLQSAQTVGLQPVETRAGLEALRGVEGMFITNSLIGVRLVASLDSRVIGADPRIEPLKRALAEVI
jgi:branched-chain amino acid aminotransferase/4-amino-4-deoxychorismate lyase